MTHILYSIHYNNIGFQVLSQVSFLLPGLPWVRPTSFCPFSTLLFRPIVLWSWNWPFNTLNLHWKNEMDLWETLNVDKSTMKGGREDVDAPFWSWDTGPKWQRESLSPRKTTFSESDIFSGGVLALKPKTRRNSMQILHETILVFDVPCGNPKSSSKSTFTDVSMFFCCSLLSFDLFHSLNLLHSK